MIEPHSKGKLLTDDAFVKDIAMLDCLDLSLQVHTVAQMAVIIRAFFAEAEKPLQLMTLRDIVDYVEERHAPLPTYR